jgi:uncharacterized RDD family membrane protein YckC
VSMTEETTAPIPTPATPDGSLPLDSVLYVGFWRRVGAFTLDVLVLGVIGQLLGLLFAHQFMTLGQSGRLVGFVIAAVYFIPAHHLLGQTLGKRLMRIRVQALNGGPVSVAAATLRYVALGVPWFANGVFFTAPNWPMLLLMAAAVVLGSILLIGILGNAYLLLFNRPSRRLIHDLIAGTVVVNASSEGIAVDSDDARVAPVQWVIVGLIPVAVFAILGRVYLSSQISPTQMAELQSAQAALNRLPGVTGVQLLDQHNRQAGRRSHVISVQLWVSDSNAVTDPALVGRAVAEILQKYPSSRATDGIAVEVSRGFDIGIASLWRRNSEFYSIAEQRHTLEDPGSTCVTLVCPK